MGMWDEIVESLPGIIRTDSDTSNLDLEDRDSWDDYAHEWVDGSVYVIFYSNVIELWTDSSNGIADYEDEAWDMVGEGCRNVLQVMTACVYLALRDAVLSAIEMVAEERGCVEPVA